ncbi:MAG: MerR family transcriptional regulator [Anaerolineae bacterium]|nr:MerR family transcriptional regulator [Anaerolineae bacterium]
MRIGELSRRSGLSIDTIRFYEKRGLLDETHLRRSENRYRDYSESTVERLALIKATQAAGFTLAEIVELFRQWESNQLTDERIALYLQKKCDEIAVKIAELQAVQRYLEAKLLGVRAQSETVARQSD